MAYTENSPNFNTPEGKIAKDVALQFISKKVGKPVKQQSILKEAETMLRLAEEIEQKYDMTLKNMCNRLNVNSENANIIFSEIANEIFRDGINWGRISVLYTFAGKLAEHAKENNNEQLIEKIGFWVATYVATKSSWIKETGKGWNGFLEAFREVKLEQESSWFQGVFAATVGLGTLAAALYIKS